MTAPRDDRVLPLTRVVGWVIAPILVLAFALLWPVPTDTRRTFAWPMMPTLTPMILAAAYLGGAYFFVRVGLGPAWHTVKTGFVPVATFATLLGIATIVHWGKFTHSSPAFWLWALLYFTAPFLIAYVFVTNRTHDVPITDDDVMLPSMTARIIAIVGALALLTGLFLFAFPTVAIRIWPWMLTPLTARVTGAVFCLGLAGIGAAWDRRWTSARIPVQVGLIMLITMVASGIRAHSELLTGRPLTWAFVVGFPILTVGLLILYVRMEVRDHDRSRTPVGR
jgi:hypothetical protein